MSQAKIEAQLKDREIHRLRQAAPSATDAIGQPKFYDINVASSSSGLGVSSGDSVPQPTSPVADPRVDQLIEAVQQLASRLEQPNGTDQGAKGEFLARRKTCLSDNRALLRLKFDPVPDNAAGFRAWRNALLVQVGKLDQSGQSLVHRWLSESFQMEREDLEDLGLLPRLDAFIASEMSSTRVLRQVPDLEQEITSYVELCGQRGTSPKGRYMLALLSRFFDLDRVRGSVLTASTECVSRFEKAYGKSEEGGSAASAPPPDPEAFFSFEHFDVPDVVPREDDDDFVERAAADIMAGIEPARHIADDEHYEPSFAGDYDDPLDDFVEEGVDAPAVAAQQVVRHKLPGALVLYEFCCDQDSMLGKIGKESGVQVVRLCKEQIDLESPGSIEQLIDQVSATPGCSLHGALECKSWSAWSRLNAAKHPDYLQRLEEEREQSRKLLLKFIRVAAIVIHAGGEVSFKWPRHAAGWGLPDMIAFIDQFGLLEALFDGCRFGLVSHRGWPMRKPWKIVTTSRRLAGHLGQFRCLHGKEFKRDVVEGQDSRRSAFYPEAMARALGRCSCLCSRMPVLLSLLRYHVYPPFLIAIVKRISVLSCRWVS